MYYDTYGCGLVNNYDIEIGEGGGAIVLLSIIGNIPKRSKRQTQKHVYLIKLEPIKICLFYLLKMDKKSQKLLLYENL